MMDILVFQEMYVWYIVRVVLYVKNKLQGLSCWKFDKLMRLFWLQQRNHPNLECLGASQKFVEKSFCCLPQWYQCRDSLDQHSVQFAIIEKVKKTSYKYASKVFQQNQLNLLLALTRFPPLRRVRHCHFLLKLLKFFLETFDCALSVFTCWFVMFFEET